MFKAAKSKIKSNSAKSLDEEVNNVLKNSEPNNNNPLHWDPEKIELKENELRSFIHPESINNENTKLLINNLKKWIKDCPHGQTEN